MHIKELIIFNEILAQFTQKKQLKFQKNITNVKNQIKKERITLKQMKIKKRKILLKN